MHATSCAWMEVIGYNTNLVKREDAPKSYADLLDSKWHGKMVKGHPGYSGAILTATFVLARDLGWPYLEKLAQQKVMIARRQKWDVTRHKASDPARPLPSACPA